ncbi:MAG TPA: FlgD immunoglobulin-like domain containing protein [Candidatus Saccharimonadales bacterium]|nr:FlgD immunoglobulin-like domain containing protein [Candidatus Saccharimonadales bacterium]
MAPRRLLVIVLLAAALGVLLVPRAAGAVTDNLDTLWVGAGETYTLHGLHAYANLVWVDPTGTLYVGPFDGSPGSGTLQLAAPDIEILGVLNGDGRGWRHGEGPGTGGAGNGGGAGHGAAGGGSGVGGSGGPAYGNSGLREIEMGSGGADNWGGAENKLGGPGGAAVSLKGATVGLGGIITANGLPGSNGTWAAGGGSGGGVLICCKQFNQGGMINAAGGAGGAGSWGGGGGAGGRVKIFMCETSYYGGVINVNGGAGGSGSWPGSAGGSGSSVGTPTPEPNILWIRDVRNDQGRQVRICWSAGCVDDPQASTPETHYTIWRRVDRLPKGQESAPSALRQPGPGPQYYPPGLWDYVATVPARGEMVYSTVVPTLADSTSAGMRYSAFFVSAATDNPFLYVDSPVDSGYSVDNIPPETPAPFKGTYLGGSTALHWGACSAPDFAAYQLYRGGSESFVPGPSNLVAAQSDTGYLDVVSGGHYYKLRAVDCSGNGSGYALLTPAQAGAVPGGVPNALWLGHPAPNPARGSATVRFGLPREGRVSLVVYDLLGRHVRTLAAGVLPAGEHTAIWDGRTDAGRAVASGVYCMRLEQAGRRLTQRLVAIR